MLRMKHWTARCVTISSRVIPGRFARNFSSELKKWLLGNGIKEKVADGIITAFSSSIGTPSVAAISAMGEKALKSLEEAVQRELDKKKSSVAVDITVDVPNARHSEKITAFVGESLYERSSSVSCLTEHIEWACGGVAACSTCHVYVDQAHFDNLDPAADDELDMLDLAWGVADTSRLACQLKIDERCQGMTITVPKITNNMF